MRCPNNDPLLEMRNVETYYGPIMAIRGVSLRVDEGEIVAVLGANGAGKTTLLKTACGALDNRKGRVIFEGQEIQRMDPDKVARLGIAHALQLFGDTRVRVCQRIEPISNPLCGQSHFSNPSCHLQRNLLAATWFVR